MKEREGYEGDVKVNFHLLKITEFYHSGLIKAQPCSIAFNSILRKQRQTDLFEVTGLGSRQPVLHKDIPYLSGIGGSLQRKRHED